MPSRLAPTSRGLHCHWIVVVYAVDFQVGPGGGLVLQQAKFVLMRRRGCVSASHRNPTQPGYIPPNHGV